MDSNTPKVENQTDLLIDNNTSEIDNVLLEVDEVLAETEMDQIQNSFHGVAGSY